MFDLVVYLVIAWAAAATFVLILSIWLAHPRERQSRGERDMWKELSGDD
jgi:hypothetical protein